MSRIIAHDGIQGQKKGVRRFRNYDGTLTEEGRRRYNYYEKKTDRDTSGAYETGKAKQMAPKTYVKTGRSGESREDLSRFTDDELKALTARAQLEQNYRNAFNTYQYSKGRKFLNGFKSALKEAGDIALSGKSLMEGINGIKKQLEEAKKVTEEKNKKAQEKANDLVKKSNDEAVKNWLLSIEDWKTRDFATKFVKSFANSKEGSNNYGNITSNQLEQIKKLYKDKIKGKEDED